MANRVTVAEVNQILDNSPISDDAIITAIITDANTLITNATVNYDYSTDELKILEKWLSAHLISMSVYRTVAEEGLDVGKVKYTGKAGKGLDATPYGQTLLSFDRLGAMKRLDLKEARFIVVETNYD